MASSCDVAPCKGYILENFAASGTDCANNQAPLDGTGGWIVLVVILRRENMPFCNADLICATLAPVNSGLKRLLAGREKFLKPFMLVKKQISQISIMGHAMLLVTSASLSSRAPIVALALSGL